MCSILTAENKVQYLIYPFYFPFKQLPYPPYHI